MGLFKKIVCIIAACVDIIVGASCFYHYDRIHHDSHLESGWEPEHVWVNQGYFILFSLFMFGLIGLIFAVIEIGLFIVPQFFEFANSMVLRGVIYVLVGIAVLGTSADLGIAAGSMSIIVGAVMLILGFIETGFNCKK